jgi:hypothetical protein
MSPQQSSQSFESDFRQHNPVYRRPASHPL